MLSLSWNFLDDESGSHYVHMAKYIGLSDFFCPLFENTILALANLACLLDLETLNANCSLQSELIE
jgi:hypothetical protein